MDELMELLEEIAPDVDFATETRLIDDKVLDSFSIVSLVAQLADTFDIDQPEIPRSGKFQQCAGHVEHDSDHPGRGMTWY